MDGALSSEAHKSSTIEIYRDAFMPQPRPRTKAWDRTRVEAHAPRLQGQKIWKPFPRKAPRDEKENFEAVSAELEKGGVGARKRPRIMGAKEDISDPQWQLIKDGELTIGYALQSPRKNGRPSLDGSNEGALLVPRKRTNANHLITPRKSQRKTLNRQSGKTSLDASSEVVVDTSLDRESESKQLDGDSLQDNNEGEGVQSISSSINDVTEEGNADSRTVDKPDRRRKSLRRCSRRLTGNEVVELAVPANDMRTSSLSVVVWSAPAFDIFQASHQSRSNIQPPAQNYSTPISGQEVKEAVNQSRNNNVETSCPTLCSSSEDNPKLHASDSEQVQQEESISKETSPKLLRDDSNVKDSSNRETAVTTPSRSTDLEPARLESTTITPRTSARTMTPKSKKTPQPGSRRSARTSRSNPAIPTDADLQSTEVAAPTATNAMGCATSRLPSQGEDNASAGAESTPIEIAPANVQVSDDEHSTDDARHCIDGEIRTEECQEPVQADPTHVQDAIKSLDTSSTSIMRQSRLLSPEPEQTDANIAMDIDSGIIIQASPNTRERASPKDVRPTEVHGDITQVVNLFPATQEITTKSQTIEPESGVALDEVAGDLEVLEPIAVTSTKANNITEHDDKLLDLNLSLPFVEGLARQNNNLLGTEPRPLVDHDDTDLLRDFVTRVKANKAAKAATGIPKRKSSGPHSPLRLPFESEGNLSPSTSDAKDDEFDVSEAAMSSNKRRKHTDRSLDEDELAEPILTRRSGRTRLPVRKTVAALSFIPVRRLGQDGDNTVTLRRSEDKEMAALTRVNTRKNKGASVLPAQVLAKKAEEKDGPASRQRALKEVFDEKAKKKKESKTSKSVVWAEELVQFQTDEGKKVTIEKGVEKEQAVEEKKTAVKVGMRSKMSLGMAVNGTPAPKRKVRGR